MVVLLLFVVFVCCFLFSCRSIFSSKQIRNVLLISIDTCRADYLSCYGYKKKTTPNIDALAAKGILFENTVSPVPITLPAHSTMLTGTIPPYHGVHDNSDYQLSESNITLAEILKDAGFTTGAAISASVLNSRFGLSQGFETYSDHIEDMRQEGGFDERTGGETNRFAIDWLEKNKNKKFFFFLHYYDPHASYLPPEPFASEFAPNRYAGEIAYTDYCIGEVLNKLKELDLYDSTLIIITADHGEMLGEHGESTHCYFIYQSAIKVPLIFKLPGRNSPARIGPIAGLVDIVPTVCGLLNIETPKHIQGKDLTGSFKADDSSQDRGMYCESMQATKYNANSLLGIVIDRFKYIQTTRPELYDLIKDPAEADNLIEEQPRHAKIMKDKLAQILEQSIRMDTSDSKADMGSDMRRSLESLGYVGTAVVEDFSFNQTKDDPKDVLEYHNLVTECYTFIPKGKYDQARITAEKLIQLRPDCYIGYEKLAKIAEEQKNYPQACIYYENALKLKPDNIDMHNGLGIMLHKQGKYDEAMAHYLKAIEIKPNYPEALDNLGIVFYEQGKTDQAIDYFRKALQVDPDYSKAYYNLANIFKEQGNASQAIKYYRIALEKNPDYPEAHNNLATVLKAEGRLAEALEHYRQALKIAPDSAEANCNLGIELQNQGKYSQAIQYYRRALASNPDHPETLNNLGKAFLALGQTDQAIDYFRRTLRVAPEHTIAHCNLGAVLKAKGKTEEAVLHYQKALQIDPNFYDVYYNLGNLRAQQGRLDEAAGHYLSALKIKPDFTKAQHNLSAVLKAQGKIDEANKISPKGL